MIETHADIETSDGAMNTFIVCPDEQGPHPIVLFLMDAPGKREELHDMARRIATAGYYVMLPNLYYRRVREFAIDGTPNSREVMFGHMNSLSNAMVVDDCRALLSYADLRPACTTWLLCCDRLLHERLVRVCRRGPTLGSRAGQRLDSWRSIDDRRS